jgi:hypothetical protein
MTLRRAKATSQISPNIIKWRLNFRYTTTCVVSTNRNIKRIPAEIQLIAKYGVNMAIRVLLRRSSRSEIQLTVGVRWWNYQ